MDKCYESFKPVPGFDNFRSYIPATVTPSIEIRSSAEAYQFQWYQPEYIIVKLANGVSGWQSARLKDVEVFSDSGTWRCVRKRYTKRLRCNNSCHLYLKLEQSNTPDKTTSIKTDNWDFSGWFQKPTNVSEIIGKWPGDETDEEFDAMMREHGEKD